MRTTSRKRTFVTCPGAAARTRGAGERGYALVALLALMTVMALALTAAAPSLQQQRRRQLEDEAITRGLEVAEAIRLYVQAKGALPNSMNDLLEGVTPPGRTKKVQILRPWAARDPLTANGEWRLVRPTDKALLTFYTDVVRFAGNRPVQTRDLKLRTFFNAQVTGLVDTGGERGEAPCAGNESFSGSGPFIGVASNSCRASVVAYYGVERHDQWVFTPLFR